MCLLVSFPNLALIWAKVQLYFLNDSQQTTIITSTTSNVIASSTSRNLTYESIIPPFGISMASITMETSGIITSQYLLLTNTIHRSGYTMPKSAPKLSALSQSLREVIRNSFPKNHCFSWWHITNFFCVQKVQMAPVDVSNRHFPLSQPSCPPAFAPLLEENLA